MLMARWTSFSLLMLASMSRLTSSLRVMVRTRSAGRERGLGQALVQYLDVALAQGAPRGELHPIGETGQWRPESRTYHGLGLADKLGPGERPHAIADDHVGTEMPMEMGKGLELRGDVRLHGHGNGRGAYQNWHGTDKDIAETVI